MKTLQVLTLLLTLTTIKSLNPPDYNEQQLEAILKHFLRGPITPEDPRAVALINKLKKKAADRPKYTNTTNLSSYLYQIDGDEVIKKLKEKKIDVDIDFGFNLDYVLNLIDDLKAQDPEYLLREELAKGSFKLHEDFGLDIYHFVKKYKYAIETHWVHTEDGYILRMHRLPRAGNGTRLTKSYKPAVLLMHGLTSDSMHWIIGGKNKSLALQLADQGFDVWLGNNRGNTWSREHSTYHPDLDKELFWDFSFEKCGQYDLPALIDYIIEKTGQEKIFYVGHSQGTTQFFAMGALRPEYNDKIALFTALAPVVYMQHMASPIFRLLAQYQDTLKDLIKDTYEFMAYNWFSATISGILCGIEGINELCAFTYYIQSGFDPYQMDNELISVQTAQGPNGISKNMILHFGQMIKSGLFQRFDYGAEKNLELYDNAVPPLLNLSAVTAPASLYYSENDFFAPVEAVEKLKGELPNVYKATKIEYQYWNHMDYITAKDVKKYINDRVIADMQEIVKGGGTTSGTTEKPSTTENPDSNGTQFSLIISLYSLIIPLVLIMF